MIRGRIFRAGSSSFWVLALQASTEAETKTRSSRNSFRVPQSWACLVTALLLLLPANDVRAQSYPRLEAAFKLAGLATDPYDHTVTDVKVQLALPDNSTLALPAFYDGGTTWRVRHTPRAAGQYQVDSITLNGSPATYTDLTITNWTITGPPAGPGYIRIDPANPRRFVTDEGRRFFPAGHNVAWNPTVSNDFPRIFQRMGAARENWTRIWMTHFYDWNGGGLNLDWPKVGGAFGQLNLTVARHWDLIVDEAERAGLGIQVVFQHHGQYASTNGSGVNPNWEQNPYAAINGGFLTNAVQFFTNATAKALTKRKLRYAIARWGCSTSIMAWELWNEVQFTDAAYAGQWSNIAAWHAEMAAFLRAQDPYSHLITTSSELTRDYWSAMDYYQHHNYSGDMIVSSRDASAPTTNWPAKPNFDGESGSIISPAQLWAHPPIWASLMSGQGGGSCPWWWDTIDPENGYFLFKSVNDFLALSGLPYQNELSKTAPKVTGVPTSALVFAPGGGWQPVTQDVFDVVDDVPEGMASAPPFLHGVWHHGDMNMPNGYKFLVNYPQAGTFAVQVRETSTWGNSNLRVVLDGVLRTNVMFYATNGGPTNITFTTPVSAGAHTILLTNGALDWVVLGDLTFDPYVPMLAAYAVGDTNFQAAWVWHRTNVYVPGATSAPAGNLEVKNLQAGDYAAAWWDCFNGGVLSNFSLTVPTNGASVSVGTPPVLRSAALVVGKSAQAALSGPALTQTLVTNSPTLWTALTLSNAGGLPLQYSLTLTGLSTVAYTALNSTQPGGPAYRWRDVSAYGRDISSATNWTQLASPKSSRDEGVAGPFNIGFEFPFFSGAESPGVFSQLYVSPNGFITFSPFAGDTFGNTVLPFATSPSNLVALAWDDLDLSAGGKIWIASDPLAGECTVQYDAVRFKSSALTLTAQVLLRTTGEILCYYKSLGRTNSCTVGVQNASRTEGLQVTFNSSDYLQSGLAVRLTPAAWFQIFRPAGIVPGGMTQALDVAFAPGGVTTGVYSASLVVKKSDTSQPAFALPVSLTIWDGQLTPLQQWRLAHFGSTNATGSAANDADWDGDGLKNIFEYAFHTNPTNANASPLSWAIAGNHLQLTFPRQRPAPADITYLYEVANELPSGVWNSGPTYTSETASDNLDGTETVTVTLNSPVGASAARYVRVRISQP